jgi:hypothetical protein
MPRLMIGVAATAVVVAAVASCSSHDSGTGSSPGSSAHTSAGAAGGPQQNKVLVDGQDQGAVQHVRCGSFGDGVAIKVGMGRHGAEFLLSSVNPPTVKTVHFSDTVVDGVEADMGLDYEAGQGEGNAEATKQGDNAYRVTGTATSSNANRPGTHSFEIDVICPPM